MHKIATFEKAAGFQVRDQILVLHIFEISFDFLCYSQLCDISWQALIQFTDADTASSARNALDGRSIPRHALLLPPQLFHIVHVSIVISVDLAGTLFGICLFYVMMCQLGTCFQSMLVPVICVFLILHTQI